MENEQCKKEKLGFWGYWKDHPELAWTILGAVLVAVVYGTTIVNRMNAIDERVTQQSIGRDEIISRFDQLDNKLWKDRDAIFPKINDRLTILESRIK